jgi:hypothetical protein
MVVVQTTVGLVSPLELTVETEISKTVTTNNGIININFFFTAT